MKLDGILSQILISLKFRSSASKMRWMRIWYFGYYLDWYPRNRVIRKGLAKAGADVLQARVAMDRLLRWPRLLLQSLKLLLSSGRPDAIIVPECDLETFPLAWMIGRILGALLVYDAFYSRWDALVNDEQEVSRDSSKARLTWLLEKFTLEHSDLVISDTLAHCEYIADLYGVDRSRFERVFIGADDELFHPVPGAEEKDFLVHYNGFYHRLQGAPAIIEAAVMLKDEPGIRFEMIGKRDSSAFKEVMEKIDQHKPANVVFVDTLPIEQMPGRMAKASVCLGIFGKTGFGERVFPNKGFQTLAMGIPLITRESRGSKEVGNSGELFLAVPPEDGKSLAEGILFLKNNPQKRKEIGQKGRALYEKRFAPGPIGSLLLARIKAEMEKSHA